MGKDAEIIEMPKRRKVSDLFRVKTSTSIMDENGVEYEFDVYKLSDPEVEECVEHTLKTRSKYIAIKRLPDDAVEKQRYWDDFYEHGFQTDEDFISFLVGKDLHKVHASAYEKTAHEPEWYDDSYLIGLQDAWNNGLEDKFNEDPEHEEAKRVHDELQRFSEQVREKVDDEQASMREEFGELTSEKLRKKAFDVYLDEIGKNKQNSDYVDYQLLYSVKWAGTDDPAFEDIEDVKRSSSKVKDKLLSALVELVVSDSEGKD